MEDLDNKIVAPQIFASRDIREEIVLDKTGKLNGRGAYICDDAECVKKLKKQKLLNRTFSCAVDDGVYAEIEENFLSEQK